jgi:hypothetical protein
VCFLDGAPSPTFDAANTETKGTPPSTGLITTTFTTANGSKITVNQTDDLAAGDTFSGTVTAEPGGKTDAERKNSEDELRGYVIEMGDQKASVMGKTFTWIVPAGVVGTTVPLFLKDSSGQQLAKKDVPIAAAGGASPRQATPSADDFHLPTLGQAGRPIQIHGPFSGNFSSSNVKVGGSDAALLAESPRKLVARSPESVVGATEIQCSEGNLTATGPFRNVAIKLTGGTTLHRGQIEPLHLNVTGLAGLQQNLPVRLQNRSTTIVQVAGGDQQTVTIHPADVQGGMYDTTRTLTAKQPGAFDITADVCEGCSGDCKTKSEKDKNGVEWVYCDSWTCVQPGNNCECHLIRWAKDKDGNLQPHDMGQSDKDHKQQKDGTSSYTCGCK